MCSLLSRKMSVIKEECRAFAFGMHLKIASGLGVFESARYEAEAIDDYALNLFKSGECATGGDGFPHDGAVVRIHMSGGMFSSRKL